MGNDELVSFNTTPVPTRTLATYFQPITTQGYGIGPVVFFQLNPNRPNSYTQQWNVALQKNIHDILTVEGAGHDLKRAGTMAPQILSNLLSLV